MCVLGSLRVRHVAAGFATISYTPKTSWTLLVVYRAARRKHRVAQRANPAATRLVA